MPLHWKKKQCSCRGSELINNKKGEIQMKQKENVAEKKQPVPPLTFRLYQNIRFNRPIVKDKDYFSPGGYELEMEKESGERVSISFDFEDFEGGVSTDDPTIVESMQKNPDYREYEELNQVTPYMLRHITKCMEWFIYTGEACENEDFHPVEIINPTILLISDSEGNDLGGEEIPITVPITPTDGLIEE